MVAAGLQARIDLDEQPKPWQPLVMLAVKGLVGFPMFPRLRVVKEDSETSREEAMQKALADLQAIRDEKIADAHREFEEDLEKAGGPTQGCPLAP